MIASNPGASFFLESYESIANSIGWTLIHFLWQGVLIAAVTIVLLKALRRCSANVHYFVACGGLCMMALSPVLTFVSINESRDVSSLSDSHLATATANSRPSPNSHANVKDSLVPATQHSALGPSVAADFERFRTSSSVAEDSWIQNIFGVIRGSLTKLAPWIAGIWAIGVLLAAARLFFGWKAINLLRSEAIIGKQFADDLSSLKQRLGVVGDVTLGLSPSVVNPLVVGWLRPLILLPAKLVEELSPVQIKAVLAHELAHVRRGDFAINLLQCIIETLLFFHPCVWWASEKVRQERENCCDDLAAKALGSRKSYAEALLCLEQTRTRNERLAMGANGGSFVERIRRLTRPGNRSSYRSGVRVAPAVLGLCVLLPLVPGLVAIASATMQQQEAEKDPMILNREIAITIVDAEGQPVPKIGIHAGVWSGDGTKEDVAFPPNRNYTTNKAGQATVELPHNYYIVRLWFSGDGFVPMFTNWEENQILDGDTPPKKLAVTMYRGTSGGGVVVDAKGNPVANAKVSLSGGGGELKGRLRLLGAYGTVETDEKGKWSFKNLNPDPGATFKASVKQNEYLPKETPLERKSLLAGSTKIALSQGIQVTGTIKDVDGKVVDDGLVIWGDSPYFEPGSQEVEIDEKGNFQTLPLVPQKKRITVVAKGYSPTTRMVDIADGMPPVNFELEHGNKLRIKITDGDGVPLARAYLTPRSWRGVQSLYSHRHPSVKPTGIPIQTNEEGVFEWDWAPADDVVWSVGVRGYLEADEIPLRAGDQIHVIKLIKKPTVTGIVRIADTGKPARFAKVTPIINSDSRGPANRRDGDAVVADAKGEFAFEMTRTGYSYRLEFSKKGYRPYITEPFDTGKFPESLEVRLEKSTPSIGTVIGPKGQPAANANVYMVNKFNSLRLNSYKVNFRVPNATSGKDGNFEFEKLVDPTTLLVLHRDGYAELPLPKTAAAEKPGSKVQLQPWARVEGTIKIAGQPIRDAGMTCRPLAHFPSVDNSIHSDIRTTIDSNGEFTLSKVGPHPISMTLIQRAKDKNSISQRINLRFKPVPGETSKVNFDFDYPLEGKLANVAELKHLNLENVSCSITKTDSWEEYLPTDFVATHPPQSSHSEALKFYQSKNDWKTFFMLSNSVESLNGRLEKDGTIKAHVSGPGTFQLSFSLSGQPRVGTADTAVCRVSHQSTFVIADGDHAIPPVEFDVDVPVAIGESVSDFEYEAGELKISLSEFKGKVTLLDFWHDRSQHVRSSNEAIASLKSAVQTDDPLAILSLQCGQASEKQKLKRTFPDELKPYVQSRDLSYEDCSAICPKFDAWSVPLAVVIDRDGKVRYIGSHQQAIEEVRQLLDESN